jgi:hypothetical protein
LLSGNPKVLTSYDILDCDWMPIKLEVEGTTEFNFIIGNTLEIEIQPTELLFIDTLHNYTQLIKELNLHASKVSKYIILHDTTTFEFNGESYSGTIERGLSFAVTEFLLNHNDWVIKEVFTNNNGLTILEKV